MNLPTDLKRVRDMQNSDAQYWAHWEVDHDGVVYSPSLMRELFTFNKIEADMMARLNADAYLVRGEDGVAYGDRTHNRTDGHGDYHPGGNGGC